MHGSAADEERARAQSDRRTTTPDGRNQQVGDAKVRRG
eukprot:SAG31_NODE_48044_length_199_cov_117.060000_1_plen_37_part_10